MDVISHTFNGISSNEHIWSDLVHQHRARKQPEYVGRTLKIDNLDKIGGSGFGTVNLYFASTYLD